MNEEEILSQIAELRQLYANAAPGDYSLVERYAWILVKALSKHNEKIGALQCRQMLAELMSMPIQRPSKLYSAILMAAIKVAVKHPSFHFTSFLNIWNPAENLRAEDMEKQKGLDGKIYPALAERMVRVRLSSQLIRPEEVPAHTTDMFDYHDVTPMVVTKITQAEVKGRTMRFATLVAPDGTEAQTEIHALNYNYLKPTNKRHYVNVGQLYDTVLHDKHDNSGVILDEGILSGKRLEEVFPVVTGFIEHVDLSHNHIHIYDAQSRHFVAMKQKFSSIQEKQFVSFVPIVPLTSKFKSAIIVGASDAASFPPRQLRITAIENEKGYASWELVDNINPITEELSSLQKKEGETSPTFVKGFVNLEFLKSSVPDVQVGNTISAIVFLRRGKDKQKRPYVAMAWHKE